MFADAYERLFTALLPQDAAGRHWSDWFGEFLPGVDEGFPAPGDLFVFKGSEGKPGMCWNSDNGMSAPCNLQIIRRNVVNDLISPCEPDGPD